MKFKSALFSKVVMFKLLLTSIVLTSKDFEDFIILNTRTISSRIYITLDLLDEHAIIIDFSGGKVTISSFNHGSYNSLH